MLKIQGIERIVRIRNWEFILLALAIWLTPAMCYAAAGDLDPSFGIDGKVITDLGENESCRDFAIQGDGKIVVVGGSDGDFALVRYNPDGSLDTSFGDDGVVTTDLGGSELANGVAIQSDGKIVVIGNPDYNLVLARYDSGGTLDTSFGTGGIATTSFDDYGAIGWDVAIQSDGRIIVAGEWFNDDGDSSEFMLVCYNSDGSLDMNFGVDGLVTIDFYIYSSAYAIAIQPDHKIVAAGTWIYGLDSVLVRCNADGTLDTSFGIGGKVTTNLGGYDGASSVAIQSDGKIVIAGSADGYFALARYSPDGSLDMSFDSDGIVTTDLDGTATDIAIQSDGRIIAVGKSGTGKNIAFTLARYSTGGKLDITFGSEGWVKTYFSSSNLAYSVAIQSDGKIVAGGTTYFPDSSGGDIALARYEAVTPAQDAVGQLTDYVLEIDLHPGAESSLNSKLEEAIAALENGDTEEAIGSLNALINYAQAQRGKKLSEEEADYLIEIAQGIIDSIESAGDAAPAKSGIVASESILAQNYPNPFNPDTWIPYRLERGAEVIIKIYTATGQLVRTLDLGYMSAGTYTDKVRAVHWNGKNEVGERVSSGLYFYTIHAGDFFASKKMVVAE